MEILVLPVKKKRRTGVIQGTCGLSDAVQCVHKHPIFLELGKLLSRCLSKSLDKYSINRKQIVECQVQINWKLKGISPSMIFLAVVTKKRHNISRWKYISWVGCVFQCVTGISYIPGGVSVSAGGLWASCGSLILGQPLRRFPCKTWAL